MLDDSFTFCVCTYNSGKTLESCLKSIRDIAPNSRLIIVDHFSEDRTCDICESFSTEVHSEDIGLGHARQMCFDLTKTKYLVFVDSDVEILRQDFLSISRKAMENEKFGAVVGMALGHRLTYGLPASLLVLRRDNFLSKTIPDYIDARETFFIQRRLDELGLETFYLLDAIRHRSSYRKIKPEWEGANSRILPSPAYVELPFALKVIILLSFNSHNLRNILYIPLFYLKFLRGFAKPKAWLKIRRSTNEIHL